MIKITQKHDVKHIKTCNHIAYILTDIHYYFVHLLIFTECYVEVIIMCDNSIFHRINEIMGQQGFELDEDYSGKMKFIYEL